MARVDFYEKPGCINNTRQKKLLRDSGHELIEYDLLNTRWNRELLLQFFKQTPVSDWFNRSAPDIKSGEIVPENCSREQALELMIHTPILIRRPLMRVNNETMVGFDQQQVQQWIGLSRCVNDDIESCPRQE